MSHSRSAFDASVREARDKQAKGNRRELEQTAQAAVPIHALVGTKDWDYFLSLIQAKIDSLTAGLKGLQEAGANDPSYDHGTLAAHKAMTMQLSVQKETLEQIVALPKKIIEQGEKANFALRGIAEE